MTTSIINTKPINYPLLGLPEGESTILIPDVTSQELIPRTFNVYYSKNTFRVIESEYEGKHQISKDFVSELVNLGFEDEEICELFIFIHECLGERNLSIGYKEIAKVIKVISSKESSPINIFRKFKQMTIDEVVSVMVSKRPYRMYEEITSYYEEDDYSDGNSEY